MGPEVIDRRTLIGGTLAATTLAALPRRARAAQAETVKLAVSPTRSTTMSVWRPEQVRGVALLSTGHGSWPERYDGLALMLAGLGFVVLAPLHVDSVRHPDRAHFDREASFGERLADLNAAIEYAGSAFPSTPILGVGHSFGTLSCLCLTGALDYLGLKPDPAVRAVLGFSTPGRVPGLVRPTAYANVARALMIVTGSADRVPGLVTDPADHLLPVETAANVDRFGYVVADGAHELVADADMLARVSIPMAAFVAGYVLDDAAARAALAAYAPKKAAGDRMIALSGTEQ